MAYSALMDLVARLHAAGADCRLDADGWRIERANQGANGLIYRAQSDQHDLAIKISARDARDRAGREFGALRALQRAGLAISAEPLYLGRNHPGLPGDAVMMAWLPGAALSEPPHAENRLWWLAILHALTSVYRAVPQSSGEPLRPAVMPVTHPADLLAMLARQAARLLRYPSAAPVSHRALPGLLRRAAKSVPWRWRSDPPRCLILCDANPANFLFDGASIRLVDWENSGWADPAFDLGDLCAQPAYTGLPADHHAWLRHEAGGLLGDPSFADRAAVYARLMLIFWVINLTQKLVAPPTRLAGVRQYSRDEIEQKRLAYWERAQAAFPAR